MDDLTFRLADGTVIRFVVPTRQLIGALIRHSDPNLDDDDIDELTVDADGVHRLWWKVAKDCRGNDHCDCGQLSLYEVLPNIPADNHEAAVRTHVHEMRSAWRHLWDADALLSRRRRPQPVATELAGQFGQHLCARCLSDGPGHIGDLLSDAHTLAIDLGEALAIMPELARFLPSD